MSWNYRICKKTLEGNNHVAVVYGIHEAYYNDNGEIWGVTENPIMVLTDIVLDLDEKEEDAVKDLKETMRYITKALEEPILDLDTLKFAKPDFQEELDEFKKDGRVGQCGEPNGL